MKKILKISSVFLILDIIIKIIVKNTLILNKPIIIIPNFFYLTYVQNTGAAWSLLSGKQTFLIIITIIIISILFFYLYKKSKYNKL